MSRVVLQALYFQDVDRIVPYPPTRVDHLMAFLLNDAKSDSDEESELKQFKVRLSIA